jgi:hypothetical protein
LVAPDRYECFAVPLTPITVTHIYTEPHVKIASTPRKLRSQPLS